MEYIGKMTHIECFTSHLNIYLTQIFQCPRIQHEKYLIEHLGVSKSAPNLNLQSQLDVFKFILDYKFNLKIGHKEGLIVPWDGFQRMSSRITFLILH